MLTGLPAASAVQPAQTSVVAGVPQASTPQIVDGAVFAVAQVGATMVVGGSFTQTESADPKSPYSTPYVMAFDAVTGAVQTSFAPQLNGIVETVLAGPVAGTVYVGGLFKTMGGVSSRSLVLLNVADGSRVTTFAMPVTDLPNIQTVKRVGNRLYVGGGFSTVGGVAHAGLVTLDAMTGAVDPFLTSTVAVNHSWTASSPAGNAKAPVGVYKLDVSPDGSKLVAIGNFQQVDGAMHDQIAMWDLTGARAMLRDWNTSRLRAICTARAYDSYVRDVEFSPDGSYFVLGNTGGYGPAGALCDSASRWESSATGQDVQPTWVDFTGKDTILSVAVTGTAVYVGGHQRWLNNGLGADSPGPGAVPRPGVAALDPANGLPLAWNPGRAPRGAGTYSLYATAAGLWMGSDTNYVGNYTYKRSKIAFFPLAGGQAAAKSVPTLPAPVYSGAVPAAGPSGVLYRVNAGGPLLQSTDAGPDWLADTTSTSPYRNSGSSVAVYGSPLLRTDATVPAGPPGAVFDDERYDLGAKGDGKEMQWHFAVPAGTAVEVRLYFANRCTCTSAPGSRTFDLAIDGAPKANAFDIVAAAGDQTGTMRSWPVTSDGSVDLLFTHGVNAPTLSAVELVPAGSGTHPAAPGSLTSRSFDGTTAGPATAQNSPFDVSSLRGATVVGGTLFYGKTDGNLYRRSISGRTYGPETLVDPYGDPAWADVATGSGGVYRGTKPKFYSQIPNLTSMFYDGSGTLYYTLYKQPGLFSRAFSPDSGIVHHDEVQLPVTLPDVTGAFLSGSTLFYVTRADGNLNRVGFDGTRLLGPTALVSGPSRDGADWRSQVLFLGPQNRSPVAAVSVTCAGLSCAADGSASADPDGSVRTYAWTWGDGSTGSGRTAGHDYADAGTYQVTLTVTDDAGATGSATQQLTVRARPSSLIAFRGSSSLNSNSATLLQIPLPADVQVGDALLLQVATSGSGSNPTPPAGWSEVTRQVFSTSLNVIWQRVATTADAPGSKVPVQLATSIKSTAQILAYSGTATTSPVSAAVSTADTPLTVSHVAPTVAVPADGSWVVSFWTDKSSTTTSWTTPAGLTVRAGSVNTGTGYLTAIMGDDGTARAAGPAPARTALTDAASRAAMTTLVLAPASS